MGKVIPPKWRATVFDGPRKPTVLTFHEQTRSEARARVKRVLRDAGALGRRERLPFNVTLERTGR